MLLFPIMLVFMYFYCSNIGSIEVIWITQIGSFLVAGEGVGAVVVIKKSLNKRYFYVINN